MAAAGGRARPRRRDERGLPRLRQRRPARHLHRQHVERRPACASPARRLHARGAAGGPGALPAPRARATRCSATAATAVSTTDASRRASRWAAGRGPPTRSTSTATAGRTSTSSTACCRASREPRRPGRLLLAAGRGALAAHARHRHALRRRVARDQPAADRSGSIASRQRNVLLRNDGRGGFDDVSGAVGLDLDQDGALVRRARRRSRRRSGSRGDGGAAGAATPHLPQRLRGRGRRARVRLRRHDEQPRRDRRTGERRDRAVRRTKVVQAGSGFLSQHSKELLFGLGASQRVLSSPSTGRAGRPRCSRTCPSTAGCGWSRAGDVSKPAVRARRRQPAGARRAARSATAASAAERTWLYEPFPAPGLLAPGPGGRAARCRPCGAGPRCCSSGRAARRVARGARGARRAAARLSTQAGVGALALALDAAERPAEGPRRGPGLRCP